MIANVLKTHLLSTVFDSTSLEKLRDQECFCVDCSTIYGNCIRGTGYAVVDCYSGSEGHITDDNELWNIHIQWWIYVYSTIQSANGETIDQNRTCPKICSGLDNTDRDRRTNRRYLPFRNKRSIRLYTMFVTFLVLYQIY